MPPRSYLITAVVLVVLVAISLPMTMGFSIIIWRSLFGAAACILGVVGAFRIVQRLRAPLWIGVALALPGVYWAADSLFALTSNGLAYASWLRVFSIANHLAFLAAAVGALRLMEMISRPHAAFRVAYGLLAASAILFIFVWIVHLMGWGFTRNGPYAASVRSLHVAARLVAYGAFVGVALLVAMRHDVEFWTGAVISLIGVYMFYETIIPMFAVGLRGDLMFWLQPVLLFIGGAAVWRIGSALHAQAVPARHALS
jgi:hypothetical protein